MDDEVYHLCLKLALTYSEGEMAFSEAQMFYSIAVRRKETGFQFTESMMDMPKQ